MRPEGSRRRDLVERDGFGPSLREKQRCDPVADVVFGANFEAIELYTVDTRDRGCAQNSDTHQGVEPPMVTLLQSGYRIAVTGEE